MMLPLAFVTTLRQLNYERLANIYSEPTGSFHFTLRCRYGASVRLAVCGSRTFGQHVDFLKD
jgi:hypothetical protein